MDNQTVVSRKWLSIVEAACYTGLSASTLNKLRCKRNNTLPYYKVNFRVVYNRLDLDRWLASHRKQSTRQYIG
jgi:Helix-turn-helix domain